MQIQNKKLAGCLLALRYTRDDSGRPVSAYGDADGVFEVPDKDAKFLLNTQGWSRPKKARALAPAADPAPAPAPTPAPPSDDGEYGENEEAPDLESIRTKAAAMELGDRYGVELTDDMKLSEMKEKLEAELFETVEG